MASVDLRQLLIRMADRKSKRSEADLQSDVKLLLLHGDLDLEDDDLKVALESPAGGGRRIDIEAGYTVIECKKDLRNEKVRADAVKQLRDYVNARVLQTGQRYVGVLTDGADWYLYSGGPSHDLIEVGRTNIVATDPDVNSFKNWIEGILATRQRIRPTPSEIRWRLGSNSSSYQLDRATLAALYETCRTSQQVRVKRMLWARLLTTAFGENFKDDDDLFLEHTYLVIVAELIAHVVIGLDLRNTTASPKDLLSGRLFADAKVGGVVESDFFDWVVETANGDSFVRDLARRISRFDWENVDHDVLKVLYESIVSPEQRHALGEYYTPDWLAQRMVHEVVDRPLDQKVLDPACGSGTFLFWAVRRFMSEASRAGMSSADAIDAVVNRVFGVDVHPVAVTLARVTYLLAIGKESLQDRRAFTVPVSIGDSLQWGLHQDLITAGDLVVHTSDGLELFATELRWPAAVAQNASSFDALVSDLTAAATNRPPGHKPYRAINAILKRYAVPEADKPVLETTYKILCRLHDDNRNHIWGYYVRNLARPYWLALEENRPDVLVGNPPWLSYRFMPTDMKRQFRDDAQAKGLWIGGAAVATSQDLSAYFVARCIQLYLREGGRFGFVMPNAALARPHFAGFRAAKWDSVNDNTRVSFDTPWDISEVRPLVFPMPACVVFGRRTDSARPMKSTAVVLRGVVPHQGHADWPTTERHLTFEHRDVVRPTGVSQSPYGKRFRQGASVVPRALTMVERISAGVLGVPQNHQRIRSVKSNQDKAPWDSVPVREAVIESNFIWDLALGTTLLPFRLLPFVQIAIPRLGDTLIELGSAEMEEYPLFEAWWQEADTLWRRKSRRDVPSLLEWIDYQGKLSGQIPGSPYRVVYNRSGTRLMAATLTQSNVIIDTKLYWAHVSGVEEADYLCAILNSTTMTELVNPLQGRGHFGPRDFYSLPFEQPVPTYDESNDLHRSLVSVGRRSRELALRVPISGQSILSARATIFSSLAEAGLMAEADSYAASLLGLT